MVADLTNVARRPFFRSSLRQRGPSSPSDAFSWLAPRASALRTDDETHAVDDSHASSSSTGGPPSGAPRGGGSTCSSE
eukprot:7071199-Prymnesium_polylepis.1